MKPLLEDLAEALGVNGNVIPSDFADFQWSGAFAQAKIQKCTPIEIAKNVANQSRTSGVFSEVKVSGAFVNLTLSSDWICSRLHHMESDYYLGIPQQPVSHMVVVDFSSPNIAKRMHIAHLRSTIIGNAIAGLYSATGHTVWTDNHIGDWGTQFGKLLVAWRRWRDMDAFQSDPVGELERLYVKFNQEEEKDDSLEEEARKMLCVLQGVQTDPRYTKEEARRVWNEFRSASLKEYQEIYDYLGISFSHQLGESYYDAEARLIVQNLLESGIAKISEGAIVVPPPASSDDPPVLIQKSDGCILYASTDLACIKNRMYTWNPTEIIYVTDMRQSLHFRQIFYVATEYLGVDPTQTHLSHVGFGLLKFPAKKFDTVDVMSSRKGNVIPLKALLDEAYSRALHVVSQINPDMAQEKKEEVAKAVSVSSLIYADLKRDYRSDILFDWNECLSLSGNSAPYLLYTLTRLHGILRRKGDVSLEGPFEISHPVEKSLCLLLLDFGGAVQRAQVNKAPHILASYLYTLASTATSFYHSCPVISDETVSVPRLKLTDLTIRVLTKGYIILGLHPLTLM